MENDILSFEDLHAYELRARQMRAEAVRDIAKAVTKWVGTKLHIARPAVEAA